MKQHKYECCEHCLIDEASMCAHRSDHLFPCEERGCKKGKKIKRYVREEMWQRFNHGGVTKNDGMGLVYYCDALESERDALRELCLGVCLDHSCGIKGWDESCPECLLADYINVNASKWLNDSKGHI